MTANPTDKHRPASQFLDIPAVAARLDISSKTVRRMIERGDLPVYRIGKLLRISEADLANYLANMRGGS